MGMGRKVMKSERNNDIFGPANLIEVGLSPI